MLRNNMRNILFFVVGFTTATLYILCGIAALRGYYTMPRIIMKLVTFMNPTTLLPLTLSICYILSLLFFNEKS